MQPVWNSLCLQMLFRVSPEGLLPKIAQGSWSVDWKSKPWTNLCHKSTKMGDGGVVSCLTWTYCDWLCWSFPRQILCIWHGAWIINTMTIFIPERCRIWLSKKSFTFIVALWTLQILRGKFAAHLQYKKIQHRQKLIWSKSDRRNSSLLWVSQTGPVGLDSYLLSF